MGPVETRLGIVPAWVRTVPTSSRPDLTGMLMAGGTSERKALTLIQDALRQHRGNITWAADELNVSSRTLRRWVAKHQALRTLAHRARLLPPMQRVHSSDSGVIAETSSVLDAEG